MKKRSFVKKGIALFLVLLIALLTCACGKKTIACENCGHVTKCKEYTVSYEEESYSQKFWLCPDCYEFTKEWVEELGGKIK